MIEYTKPIDISGKVKIGRRVPEEAIEICSFNNNINKTKTSNSISSSAEKNLSQSKLGKGWRVVKDRDYIDNTLFPKEIEYSDVGGYSGVIKYKRSEWIDKVRYLKKHVNIIENKEYSGYQDIPKTTEYAQDEYYGTLNLTKVQTIKKNTTTSSYKVSDENKIASKIIYSDTNSFSSEIPYENEGFKGSLKLFGVFQVSNQNEATVTNDEILSKKIDGIFPTFIEQNNNIYYPTGEFVDRSETHTEWVEETQKVYETKIIEEWVKHYGICRYWGGGGRTPNNYYGDPDYRFRVDGWTAKGYFSSIVTPTLQRYGHNMNILGRHRPEKYPIDIGGYWDHRHGETDGIKWTYDIESAQKFGGSSDPAKGGVVWASDLYRNNGYSWPPKGYEQDHDGGWHRKIHTGSSGQIDHNNILCVKDGPQKTSRAGHYNAAGWYCRWFRDLVLFYKGLTKKTITIEKDVTTQVEHIVTTVWKEGKYQSVDIKQNGCNTYYKAIYIGNISKPIYFDKEILTSVKVNATYEGTVTKKVVKYDGKAFYEGMVFKKVFVDPGSKLDNKYNLLIVDTDGYLKNINKEADLRSQYIKLTNIVKNGEPIFYTNKVKKKLYLPNGPIEEVILDCNYVDVKYDKNIINNIEFLVKLIPFKTDFYTIEILTNVQIGSGDNVYCYFAESQDKMNKEQLFSELIYSQGVDFKAEAQEDTIHYRFKFGDNSTKVDTRKKITFTYKIETTDSSYISNVYNATIVNREYALEGEKLDFLLDKMCISPVEDKEKLTAKEVLAKDNSIDILLLKDKKVTIKILSNQGQVDGYTEPNGNGFIYASTYEDTGYPIVNNGVTEYTRKEKSYLMNSAIGSTIYNAYYVVLENQDGIQILDPYNNNEFKNWYSRIKYFPFKLSSSRNDTNVTATYSLLEYVNDNYDDTLDIPFKRIKEEPIILNNHSIKLSREDILFRTNKDKAIDSKYFKLYTKSDKKELSIIGFDIKNSIAITKEVLSRNIQYECEYVYSETSYEYVGYEKGDIFYHLDLNPNKYHDYVRLDNGQQDYSYNLFNHTVYLFLRPTKVINHDTKEVIEDNTNSITVYHKIDNPEQNGVYDLLIGIISTTPLSSMLNTKIKKTHILGGGIKEKYIEINKENLDSFYDINTYGEKAIQKNGTIIIKVSKDLLKEYKEEDILNIVNKHLPVGILPIIVH